HLEKSSGRSCHFQDRPASLEKTIPCEETIRISAPSRETRTESTGSGSDENDSCDHDFPASLDLNSPSSVAANHAASLNAKSLTTRLSTVMAGGFCRAPPGSARA